MSMDEAVNRRICIFIPSFGTGGVERMLVNLSRGIDYHQVPVDFIVNRADSVFLQSLPAEVRLLEIRQDSTRQRVDWLAAYLQKEKPEALLSAKLDDDWISLAARRQSGAATRIYLRPGTNFSEKRRSQRFRFIKRWRESVAMRRLFGAADGVIAVSRGVASDVNQLFGVAAEKIKVIPNPTVTPEIHQLSKLPVDHPWLNQSELPVVIGIGRFSNAKDFPALIHAFAKLRAQRACKLIILGDGHKRSRLLELAQTLGVSQDVDLPGFRSNPYAYLSRASLFALSSIREGSPNVLIEALALGVPVVSTNCNSGPNEILQSGKYGPLVPVGDVLGLMQAMEQVIDAPFEPDFLRTAVAEYRYDLSACRYLQAFGLSVGRRT